MPKEKTDFRFKMLHKAYIIPFYLKYYECMYLHLLILTPYVNDFDGDCCLLLTLGCGYMWTEHTHLDPCWTNI